MSEIILERERESIPSNEYLLEEIAKIRQVLKQLKNLTEKTFRSAKPKAKRKAVKRRKSAAKRRSVKRRAAVKRKSAAKRRPVKRRAAVKRKVARRRK